VQILKLLVEVASACSLVAAISTAIAIGCGNENMADAQADSRPMYNVRYTISPFHMRILHGTLVRFVYSKL
jgi:hypothetical protein